MVTQLINETRLEVIYPDSDGEPMADNTKQFRWIVVYAVRYAVANAPYCYIEPATSVIIV